MTTTPPEPSPLPPGEPTSAQAVLDWLTEPDAGDDADALDMAVDAVNDLVVGLPIADRQRGKDAWPPRVRLGATMLAARVWRRKGTPGGVEAVGDFGVAYVRRNDPDVAQMLDMGDYAVPGVG